MGKTRLVGLALANLFSSTAVSPAAVLESPAQGGALSGLGFISGWKCDAGNITVTIDGGKPLPVALPQARRALRPVCGPIRPGFIMQLNWTVLGDGAHEVVAYDDGGEFARATFTVGSPGAEFLEDVVRRTVIDGVPAPGESAFLEWNASTQHFAILAVWTGGRAAAYDRAWWQRYNQDLVAGTYATQEFLYVEEPAVAACEPGALAVGARSRALEAANQIRALHGLSAVRYSRRSDQQVQEAALIQAANKFLNHRPAPSAKCYTRAGAEGSRTSNLWRVGRRDRPGVDSDPAADMVSSTTDSTHIGRGARASQRRWVLNPFAVHFAYGQVAGYAAQKVFRFEEEPDLTPRIAVDFVAFPFEVYPFNLVGEGSPWSFSVIEDKADLWGNKHDYFRQATITVLRTEDETALAITGRYTDSASFGLPNVLSWQVAGWEYDTLYEVEISNVAMQSGETRSYSYPVLIERDSLEQ